MFRPNTWASLEPEKIIKLIHVTVMLLADLIYQTTDSLLTGSPNTPFFKG